MKQTPEKISQARITRTICRVFGLLLLAATYVRHSQDLLDNKVLHTVTLCFLLALFILYTLLYLFVFGDIKFPSADLITLKALSITVNLCFLIYGQVARMGHFSLHNIDWLNLCANIGFTLFPDLIFELVSHIYETIKKYMDDMIL